ncbi:MAG TPA: hypothetical protein VHZ03_04805 [Trebonia sp.]|nr:hypothetical protein [Trebonia sp.]
MFLDFNQKQIEQPSGSGIVKPGCPRMGKSAPTGEPRLHNISVALFDNLAKDVWVVQGEYPVTACPETYLFPDGVTSANGFEHVSLHEMPQVRRLRAAQFNADWPEGDFTPYFGGRSRRKFRERLAVLF